MQSKSYGCVWLKLSQQIYAVKSSQAINCLKIESTPNFSDTVSVFIVRDWCNDNIAVCFVIPTEDSVGCPSADCWVRWSWCPAPVHVGTAVSMLCVCVNVMCSISLIPGETWTCSLKVRIVIPFLHGLPLKKTYLHIVMLQQMFSWQWLWRLLSSEIWCHVDWCIITSVSEECASSILRLYSEDRWGIFLLNTYNNLTDHVASHHRRR